MGNIPILLFTDMLAIAGCAFLTIIALDALWVLIPDHQTLIDLQPDWVSGTKITELHLVSLPGLLIAVPFFTFFSTATYGQKLTITEDGIGSTGVFFGTVLLWNEIQSVKIVNDRSVAQIATSDYRPLEKTLHLESDEDFIVIHQPVSKRKKNWILDQLKTHLPESPKQQLNQFCKNW